ncbi:hypothetical protein AAFC00_003678 [Neodothiora populina]|uniref:Uncharacterized protein n=1 Tax=Neodothiora populina TaxID=2781224 RepID=A0ABR3PFJ2_9PEZI
MDMEKLQRMQAAAAQRTG